MKCLNILLASEFKKTGYNKWKCKNCNLEVSIIASEDEDDSEAADSPSTKTMMERMELLFLKHFEPFKQELREIKSNMKTMEKDIKLLKESHEDTWKVNNKNNKVLTEIGKRVSKLESGLDVNVNDIFRETEERKRRETCIIGYNIPESDKSTGAERQNDDKSKFIQLLPENCGIKTEEVKINRIGKVVDGKIRPVKIELPSRESVRMVLRSKLKEESIKFKHHLTITRRDKLKKLRNELKRREEDGEKDLIIRYKFGELFIDRNQNF